MKNFLKKCADIKTRLQQRFNTWKNEKKIPKTSAQREKAEDGFFKILGIGSTVISAILMFCWGEGQSGAAKTLDAAKISHVQFQGFDKEARNCFIFTNPYRTKFNGVAADGKQVSGVVCKNYLFQQNIVLNTPKA